MKVLAFTHLKFRYYYKPEKIVRLKITIPHNREELPTIKQLSKTGSILNNIGEV